MNDSFNPQKFVNRTKQLDEITDRVQKVLNGSNNDPFIKFYSGGGGLGKTWLLKQIQAEMDLRSINSTYIDLSVYARPTHPAEIRQSITVFLKDLIKQFNPSRDTNDCSLDELSWYMGNDFEDFTNKNKAWVLLVDNVYTPSWEFLKELENYVFGPLSTQERIIMVFTGYGSEYPWKTPELQLRHEVLMPFELESGEIENQLRKLAQPGQNIDIKTISLGSSGIPGLITYLMRFGSPEGYRCYVQDLLENLNLHENPDLILDLRCLAYLPYFTDSHISAVKAIRKAKQKYGENDFEANWQKELDIIDARKTREVLLKSGILVLDDKKSGFVLDGIIRRAIQGSLQFEDWIEAKRIVSKLYDFFWNEYRSGLDDLEFQTQSNYPSKQTSSIIGYQREYVKVCDLIDKKEPKIIYVYGPGGIGKTRFIEAVRHDYLQNEAYYVLDVIDLFRPIFQQKDSLQRKICESFRKLLPTDDTVFAEYKLESDTALADYIRLGATRHLSESITNIWNKDYMQLEAKKTVILFLDTAEKLFYPNPISDMLELAQTDSVTWMFKEFFPNIENTIVLISGRLPKTDQYVEKLFKNSNEDLVETIELRGFEEGDIYEYWEKLEEVNSYDTFFFNVLNSIRKTDLKDFYQFYTSENPLEKTVNPLALAILVDLAVFDRELFSGDLLKKLQDDYRVWIQQTKAILATYNSKSPRVLKFLVKKLMELVTLDFTVREFARARKGVNENLFLELTDGKEVDRPKIRRLLSSAFIANLSIVKLHENNEDDKIILPTLYLHDAVYEHLDFWDMEQGTTKRRNDYKIIDEYYRKEMKNIRNHIVDSFTSAFSIGKVNPVDTEKIFRLMTRWDELAAERVYYALDSHFTIENFNNKPSIFTYSDIQTHFTTYYLYSEEALASQDKILDRILETELLSYWYEHEEALKRVNFDKLMIADLAVRSIKRKFYFEDYSEKQSDLRKRINDLMNEGAFHKLISDDEIAKYDLALLEILINVYGDNYSELTSRLLQIISNTEELQSPRKAVILARANNILGLLYRKQGAYDETINSYQEAIQGWRLFVELESEQANTLTNVSFVLAEKGRLHAALDWGNDAKELRLRRGILPGIGQAYNVLGHIYLRQGLYEEALKKALSAQLMLGTKSYEQFREMEEQVERVVDSRFVKQMQGFNAILLAECYRRMAGSLGADPRIQIMEGKEERLSTSGLLQRAAFYANLGSEIFETLEQYEGIVEGLVEEGCAYRDQIAYSNKDLTISKNFMYDSEKKLKRAIEISEDNNLFIRKFDAMVDLAWLYYFNSFVDDENRMHENLLNAYSEATKFLDDSAVEDYLISPNHYPVILSPNAKPKNYPIFALLGKVSLLQGKVDYYFYDIFYKLSCHAVSIKQSKIRSNDLLFHAENALTVLKNMIDSEQQPNQYKDLAGNIKTSLEKLRESNLDEGELHASMEKFRSQKRDSNELHNLSTATSKLIDGLSDYYGFCSAKHFALSFEYNLLKAEIVSRDMTRAMKQLHDILKTMRKEEMLPFLGHLDRVKSYYHVYGQIRKGWYIDKFLVDRLFVAEKHN